MHIVLGSDFVGCLRRYLICIIPLNQVLKQDAMQIHYTISGYSLVLVKPHTFRAKHRTEHFPNILEQRASQRQAHRNTFTWEGETIDWKQGWIHKHAHNESQHLTLSLSLFFWTDNRNQYIWKQNEWVKGWSGNSKLWCEKAYRNSPVNTGLWFGPLDSMRQRSDLKGEFVKGVSTISTKAWSSIA